MNEKALHTLEYDKIIEKLVGYAVSPMAKERAAALRPSAAMSDIIIWQEETTEATTMVLKKGTPSFGGFREIRPQLKRASMAGILSIAELMSVGEFAYVCRKVKNYARKENKDEVYARLDEYFDLITPLDKLENEISRCILSETEVADDASAGLRSVRREIKASNERVKDHLNGVINSSAYRNMLQDFVITIRNDRYCVPVKAEYRSSFPGMIHDQSNTGSTLFMEPLSVIQLNNKIKELQAKEKEEIEKIAENLSLTPSDKETAELWSGEPQEETGGTDEVYKVDDYTIQQIGDTIRSDFYDDDDRYSRVTAKLNSVSLQDNFDGLPAVDDIGNPIDYSQYLNADGTVKDDVRTWYSRGDGVNTLDTKIKEETVPQRVLVMHLTYTNECSITQEICVCPSLLQKNGDRLDYGAVACEPTDETMYCNGTLDDLKYGEFFLFTTDREHSKNNITNVAPGESVDATVAFLMDEDELQDLYADILGYGQKTVVSLGDLQ